MLNTIRVNVIFDIRLGKRSCRIVIHLTLPQTDKSKLAIFLIMIAYGTAIMKLSKTSV